MRRPYVSPHICFKVSGLCIAEIRQENDNQQLASYLIVLKKAFMEWVSIDLTTMTKFDFHFYILFIYMDEQCL